jgi:ribosomal protein S1
VNAIIKRFRPDEKRISLSLKEPSDSDGINEDED